MRRLIARATGSLLFFVALWFLVDLRVFLLGVVLFLLWIFGTIWWIAVHDVRPYPPVRFPALWGLMHERLDVILAAIVLGLSVTAFALIWTIVEPWLRASPLLEGVVR